MCEHFDPDSVIHVADGTGYQSEDGSIRVWEFCDAPKQLRDLTINGGDEDYLAFVPQGEDVPLWISGNTSFGCCSIHYFAIEGGVVAIGSHA